MTNRTTSIFGLIVFLTLFTLTSCDILDSKEKLEQTIFANFDVSESTVESKDGDATLSINKVKFLVDDLNIQRKVKTQDTVLFVGVQEFPDRFPKVVSFSPGSDDGRVKLGQVREFGYDITEFTIHKPSGDVEDSELKNSYSLIIEGTYDGNAFTYQSEEDFSYMLNINPMLEVNNQTSWLNMDVIINTKSLFRDGEGGLLDPTTSKGKQRITKKMKISVSAEEGNRKLLKYQDIRIPGED